MNNLVNKLLGAYLGFAFVPSQSLGRTIKSIIVCEFQKTELKACEGSLTFSFYKMHEVHWESLLDSCHHASFQ